jgi:hypothetical protein
LIPTAIILVYYYYTLIYIYLQYRKIKTEIDFGGQVATALKEQYDLITGTLRMEERVGIVFYPIAVFCGGLLRETTEGHTIGEVMTNQVLMIVLGVCAVIFTPLGAWVAKKMNQRYYGAMLDKLKANLDELDGFKIAG